MRARLLILAFVLTALGMLGASLLIPRAETPEVASPPPDTTPASPAIAVPHPTDSPHAVAETMPVQAPIHAYEFTATESGTVESFMQTRQDTGLLAYESSRYPMLGSFLESIGDLENEGGQYWMLYINGSLSSRGMSSTKVVPGDRIEWRYE